VELVEQQRPAGGQVRRGDAPGLLGFPGRDLLHYPPMDPMTLPAAMNVESSAGTLEYGRTGSRAIEAAGRKNQIQYSERTLAPRNGKMALILAERCAWDLNPRHDPDGPEAAAAPGPLGPPPDRAQARDVDRPDAKGLGFD
jgi:hypothetical protein